MAVFLDMPTVLGKTRFRPVSYNCIERIVKCHYCASLIFLNPVCGVLVSLYWKVMENGSVGLCHQTSLSVSGEKTACYSHIWDALSELLGYL